MAEPFRCGLIVKFGEGEVVAGIGGRSLIIVAITL